MCRVNKNDLICYAETASSNGAYPHETKLKYILYSSLKCYSFFYHVVLKLMCFIELDLSFEGFNLFLDPT